MNTLLNIPSKIHFARNGASNKDIRIIIDRMIPIANRQMIKEAQRFRGENTKTTAQNIWNYLKYKINYKADGNEQIVKAPSALVRSKEGDCKSYAVFTSAILTNLGIPHKLVYTSYTSDPTPQHVYVQTNSGVIIDAVWNKFNAEKKAKHKYFKNMNVKGITGLGATEPQGIGKFGDTRSGAKHKVNLVPLAPARAAFRWLVKNNVWGLAKVIYDGYTYQTARTGLTVDNWKNGWYNLGGSWSKLADSIKAGYNKRPFGIKIAPKEIKDAYNRAGKKINGTESGSLESDSKGITGLAAVITAVSPIIIALMPVLKAAYDALAAAGKLPNDNPPPPDFEQDVNAATQALEEGKDPTKTANLGIIAAIGAGLLLFGMMSKGDKK